MQGIENLAELQRQWLQSLETQFQLVNKNLQAFLSAPPGHGSAELGPWATYLSQVEAYLAQYRAMALYLKGLGYDQLYQRLEQIIADVHRAGGIYAEMYKSALDSEGKVKAIQDDVSKRWLDTMAKVMETNRKALDDATAQWQKLREK